MRMTWLARISRRAMLFAGAGLSMIAAAHAQPDTRPATTLPSSVTPAIELGPEWDGSAIGLFLSPPLGMKVVPNVEGEAARFVDAEREWQMTVQRVELTDPLPLRTPAHATGQNVTPGLIDVQTARMIQETDGQLLRKDVIYLPGNEAGLIVLRYSAGPKDLLQQRALIRSADRLYYVVSLTTPVARGSDANDPQLKLAVDAFLASLDTVTVLDLTAVRENQDDRLLRTRNLLVNLTEAKLRSVLVPEQYLRIVRDGRDVGYQYQVEELGNDVPRRGLERVAGSEGVVVGTRSRVYMPKGQQVDAENWSWVSFKMRRESWSYQAFTNIGRPDVDYYREFGVSAKSEKFVDGAFRDVWQLDVRSGAKKVSVEPIKRQLPPFYMPAAVAQLLPRLLDLKRPNTYLVAVFDSERRELVLRYLDVKPISEVKFNGAALTAVVVEDRLGLRGAVTRHLFKPDGGFIGTEAPSTKMSIIPTTREELIRIWSDPNLTRPSEVAE
jgi:hypothetical protein